MENRVSGARLFVYSAQQREPQALVLRLRLYNRNATNPNCGKTLRAKDTNALMKIKAGREKHSGMVRILLDWAIRSQAPTVVMIRLWRRFRDHKVLGRRDLITPDEGLRYDPLPGFNPDK